MDSRVRALYQIDPRPEGPDQARQIIAEELSSRLPADVVDDIKLMVSELVTNGIVRGAVEDDVPVTLELLVNGHSPIGGDATFAATHRSMVRAAVFVT
jgi:hypothetical protein